MSFGETGLFAGFSWVEREASVEEGRRSQG